MKHVESPSEPADRYSLFNSDRSILLADGVKKLTRWYKEMGLPFSDEGKSNATRIEGDHPLAAFTNFSSRPDAAVIMADALAADLVEYEASGKLLGRNPREWQLGALQFDERVFKTSLQSCS